MWYLTFLILTLGVSSQVFPALNVCFHSLMSVWIFILCLLCLPKCLCLNVSIMSACILPECLFCVSFVCLWIHCVCLMSAWMFVIVSTRFQPECLSCICMFISEQTLTTWKCFVDSRCMYPLQFDFFNLFNFRKQHYLIFLISQPVLLFL